MLPDGLLVALGGILLVLAAYIYLALVRQINARAAPIDIESEKRFGLPEAGFATFLVLILLLGVKASFSGQPVEINSRVLLENLLVNVAIVLFIVALLTFRGFDLDSLAGFSRISFLRAVSTGIILLLAAYPLLMLAESLTQVFLRDASSKQSIVELFGASNTMDQRIMIIVFAVVIAPVVEEFLFRFFIYGVVRRYSGRFVGIAFTSLLFATVHTHLPSFAPLLVLGACLAIAYEWSGSILVSMTMHSVFNAVSLTALAFPELSPQ